MSLSALGASLIGGAPSIVGNVIGAFSNAATNASNRHINQMNNEFNERMMQKQMDYNTMMWEKNNEYNSPAAQKRRLEEAGFNPYLNGLNTGTASSQGSTSMASASSPIPMQSFNPNFQGIPSGVLAIEQAQLLKAQKHQQLIDNQTRNIKNLQELSNIHADTLSKQARTSLDRTLNNYSDAIHLNQIAESRERQSLMREQSRNIVREGLLMDKNLAIFDERTRLELAQMSADVLLSTANMRYTKQQTIHEVQKTIETVARTRGIKISNDVARRTADSIVKKAYYEGRPSNSLWQMIGGIGSDIGYSFFGKGR